MSSNKCLISDWSIRPPIRRRYQPTLARSNHLVTWFRVNPASIILCCGISIAGFQKTTFSWLCDWLIPLSNHKTHPKSWPAVSIWNSLWSFSPCTGPNPLISFNLREAVYFCISSGKIKVWPFGLFRLEINFAEALQSAIPAELVHPNSEIHQNITTMPRPRRIVTRGTVVVPGS